jgi:hypothetical protein
MIQSIVFAKNRGWDLDKSAEWLQEHGYTAKKAHTTENLIRYRQHVPKRKLCFYRTHKLGSTGISLILEYPNGQEGLGFYSDVKDRIKLFLKGPKTTASNKVETILQRDTSPIVKMWACKAPIVSGVKKVLNWLSMGRLQKKADSLGYSEIWHGYLVIQLEDGKKFKLEKNHTVEIYPATHNDLQNAAEIPVTNGLTMKKLMDNASSKHFYSYSAKGNNCQNFVQDIVHKNNLAESTAVKKIVEPQDSAALVGTLGPLSGLTDKVTGLAARGQRVINGDGLVKGPRIKLMG